MVASGNMTGTNLDNYYSSFISFCSMRTVILLAELNNIEIRTGDIRNAYLTARNTEKIVFNSGTGFSPFKYTVRLLLIKTALYGLKSSGARLHSSLSYSLTALNLSLT